MSEIHDTAIIGAGASATLLAWNLRHRHDRNCVVIDPTQQPALGLAYRTRSIDNLLNVPASGMSALADDCRHFTGWLQKKIDPAIDRDAFIPRAIYGLYLQDLFRQAAPLHARTRVMSCMPDNDIITLRLEDGRCLSARQVVLALGHFSPPLLPGLSNELVHNRHYHHQVWDSHVPDAIASTDPVLLIGSGLTAVDQIMQLRAAGHTGRIMIVSRHARLPQRHDATPKLDTPVITPGSCVPRCTDYLHQFNAVMKRGISWRACIDSLRPVTNQLWTDLPQEEKARFRRHLQRRWDVVRHRMAPRIAEALDAGLANGSLSLHAGHLQEIEAMTDGLRVMVRHGDRIDRFEVAHVLNCTGPNLHYDRVDSPLLHDLFARGLARPGQGGAGLDTTDDGQLLGEDNKARLPLYTLGPARQGTLFESIAIPEIRSQAYDLARLLNGRLARIQLQDLCA